MSAAPEDEKEKKVKEALRTYGLPTRGDYPFVPPKGWFPTMPLWPGGNLGFIDRKGDHWKEGRSITKGQWFEWDVQLSSGGHLNVDLNGNISHGPGKAPKKKPAKARGSKSKSKGRRRKK